MEQLHCNRKYGKPVYPLRLKPVCSVTETSWNIEILHVASSAIILSRELISKVLIRQCIWAVWSALFIATKSGFSTSMPMSQTQSVHATRTNKMICTSREDSDQPGHQPSQIIVVSRHLMSG